MIPPVGYAIAVMTVMLWILWSESLRSRRPSPALYVMRILLFLGASGVLIWNMLEHPWQFNATGRGVVVLAVIIGVFGAGYFARRLVRRA